MNRTLPHILALAGLAVVASCGGRDEGFHLRLGHDQSKGHPYDLAAERFAQAVDSATGGAVHIAVFPAAQLGDSPEQIEGLYLGTLDLALAAFSHASQFCPELGLFEDEDHFAAVFDGEVGDSLDAACSRAYSIRLLSTFTSGYRVLIDGKRPIESPSDLAGLKIRVMGGEADALTWQVFGAIPVPMPYSEVYSALQAGVIDGAENEPVSVLTNRFYEAAPYIAPTDHLILPMGLFMSERTLEKLPERYRTTLRAEARRAAVWERELMIRSNADALDEMKRQHGVTISAIDPAELRASAIPIQERVASELHLEDLLKRVRDAAR
jgi:TRAP-type transport system periplasmic protein